MLFVRHSLFFAAAVAAALAVVACGGDDPKDRGDDWVDQPGARPTVIGAVREAEPPARPPGGEARTRPPTGDAVCDTMFGIFDKSSYGPGRGTGGFASQGEYNVKGFTLIVDEVYRGVSFGTRREIIQSETAIGYFFRELIERGLVEVVPLERFYTPQQLAKTNADLVAAGALPITASNVILKSRVGQADGDTTPAAPSQLQPPSGQAGSGQAGALPACIESLG